MQTAVTTAVPTLAPTATPSVAPTVCNDDVGSATSCAGWAASGECQSNAAFMAANCAKSCGLCAGSTPTPTTCADAASSAASCLGWAVAGECDSNAAFMATNCAKSCGLCTAAVPSGSTASPTACADASSSAASCPGWASAGECDSNAAFMAINCAKSCRLCSSPSNTPTAAPTLCTDDPTNAASCAGWAAAGECTGNAAFMTANCAKSCGRCGQSLCLCIECCAVRLLCIARFATVSHRAVTPSNAQRARDVSHTSYAVVAAAPLQSHRIASIVLPSTDDRRHS